FARPIEPIVLSICAHEVLRIFGGTAGPEALGGVFALSHDISAAHFNDTEFVAANPPIENLFHACRGVEAPAGLLADQRNRKRPLLLAHDQDRLGLTVELELVCFVIGGN